MIRAVVFDAVGTVMFPSQPVADSYRTALATHCGIQMPREDIADVVRAALQRRSTQNSLRTDEAADQKFWRQLIFGLCGEHSSREACFEDLYQQFGDPACWSCYGDVVAGIRACNIAGVSVAIASNFDSRLHGVLDGLPPVSQLPMRFVSSAVGYRKPAEQFFARVCHSLQLEPAEVLFVGDDLTNDVRGAVVAGCAAAWICRENDMKADLPGGTWRLSSLAELSDVLSSAEEAER